MLRGGAGSRRPCCPPPRPRAAASCCRPKARRGATATTPTRRALLRGPRRDPAAAGRRRARRARRAERVRARIAHGARLAAPVRGPRRGRRRVGRAARARARARALARRGRAAARRRARRRRRGRRRRGRSRARGGGAQARREPARRGPRAVARARGANAARYARPATANAMPTGPVADPSSLAAADMLGIALAGRYADELGLFDVEPDLLLCDRVAAMASTKRQAAPVRARRAPLAARAAARAAAAARVRRLPPRPAPRGPGLCERGAAGRRSAFRAGRRVARAAHGRAARQDGEGGPSAGEVAEPATAANASCVARAAARPAPPTRGRETRRPDTALAHAPRKSSRGILGLTARTMGRLNGGARANSRPLDVSLCGHQLTIGPAPASRAATATAARPPWPRQPSRQGQVRLLP